MYAVGILEGIGLLLQGEELALTNCVERRVCILPVLRKRGDVHEIHGHFHGPCHLQRRGEESSVGAHVQRGRVRDWGGLLGALDAVRVVPIHAPTWFSSTRHMSSSNNLHMFDARIGEISRVFQIVHYNNIVKFQNSHPLKAVFVLC